MKDRAEIGNERELVQQFNEIKQLNPKLRSLFYISLKRKERQVFQVKRK
jgi:hypothetical protein